MKPKLHPTQNNLREQTRRAVIDLLNLFTDVSRGVDKLLWLVEAHLQAKD